ncbi:MAG: hypothetical protein SPL80_03815 [Bacilli bacterium]|nr:hypothetical protein [Bacilli bacterium]
MKRKPFIGLLALSLASAAMAGTVAYAAGGKKTIEARAEASSISFQGYELLNHLGEAYTPEGGQGTVTVNEDTANDTYVITLDNLSFDGAGELARLGSDTSCLFYCNVAKDVVINLIGDSKLNLRETSSFVPNQYCVYFDANNVLFQNDPSEEEGTKAKLGIEILTDYGGNTETTPGGTFYGLTCTGNLTVSECTVQAYSCGNEMYRHAHRSYGAYLGGDFTIKDEAQFKAYGGYVHLMYGDGNPEGYGVYLNDPKAILTLDSGYLYSNGGNVYGNSGKPATACGIYANTIIQNSGSVEVHSGMIDDSEGRGNHVDIKCNSYTMNGGQAQIWCSARPRTSTYCVWGLDGNAVFTLNSAAKLDIRANSDSAGVESRAFQNIKLVNPTMHGLSMTTTSPNDWKQATYTVVQPNAAATALNNNIKRLWFASVQGEVTQLPAEEVTYDGEAHELFSYKFKELTGTDAIFMCAVGESEEYAPGIPKFTDAGNYVVKYYFTPNPENQILVDGYNASPVQTSTFTLYQADPTFTAPTAKEGLKANGSALELINPGSSTTSTMVYRIGEEGEFSEAIPTATEAGTYTVQYKAAGSKNYKESEVGSVVVIVLSAHEHQWAYTANGATITASCSAADCPTTEGLTLTLEAPKGAMHYDGTAKAATLKAGYSADAFPSPEIKYYSGDKEVASCVNVGKYLAKVTFGNAVAMVEFEILGKTMVDPTESSAVSIEIDDAVVPENVELRVEVRADVAEKDIAEDYAKIQEKLEANEQISKVYDVRLIQTVGGVEKEIQPSDIKPGLKVTAKMAIPEGMDIASSRILHIHSLDDMEFVSGYKVEGNNIVFEIDRLSQFAFITKANVAPANGGGLNGGIIALIVILSILALLGICFALLYFVFPKYIIIIEDGEEKIVKAVKLPLKAKDGKKEVTLITFKFRKELRVEEQVFDTEEDADAYLKVTKGKN